MCSFWKLTRLYKLVLLTLLKTIIAAQREANILLHKIAEIDKSQFKYLMSIVLLLFR